MYNSIAFDIVIFIIFIYSVILHEIAHGAIAEYFGDDTARVMGRITLNPISHIDPYFTILVPVILFISHLPLIGGARPVPVNYYNLRNFRWGVFWVSIAGVLTNLFIAFAASLPLHLPNISQFAHDILLETVIINVVLAIFNMIPIPPLDGSKVFAALLGERAINKVASFEMRGIWGILPFIVIIYVLLYTGIFNSILDGLTALILRIFGVS